MMKSYALVLCLLAVYVSATPRITEINGEGEYDNYNNAADIPVGNGVFIYFDIPTRGAYWELYNHNMTIRDLTGGLYGEINHAHDRQTFHIVCDDSHTPNAS
jgi:hypothetical protein